VALVIDEWILLEYACTFLPALQNAIVEAVSKSRVEVPGDLLRVMGVEPGLCRAAGEGQLSMPFTPLAEIERAIERAIAGWDLDALARRSVAEQLDCARGRV
jgi:hypothetical protein